MKKYKPRNNRQLVYRVMAGINNSRPFEMLGGSLENAAQYMRQLMETKVVTFRFRNKAGDVAERRGTRYWKFCQEYYTLHPSEMEERYVPYNVLRYWDLDAAPKKENEANLRTIAGDWRSARTERIIGYFSDMEDAETVFQNLYDYEDML